MKDKRVDLAPITSWGKFMKGTKSKCGCWHCTPGKLKRYILIEKALRKEKHKQFNIQK